MHVEVSLTALVEEEARGGAAGRCLASLWHRGELGSVSGLAPEEPLVALRAGTVLPGPAPAGRSGSGMRGSDPGRGPPVPRACARLRRRSGLLSN